MNTKKFFSIVICLLICFGITGCNSEKKAFEATKIAYENISSAYESIDIISQDIYTAGKIGAYDGKSIRNATDLAEILNLTDSEVMGAIIDIKEESNGMPALYGIMRYFGEFIEEYFGDNYFSAYVNIVIEAYKGKGTFDEIEEKLKIAKEQVMLLGEDYADYEHYAAIKKYYTKTLSLIDYCKEPTGTFVDLEETISDYKKDIKEYKSELEYLFEI